MVHVYGARQVNMVWEPRLHVNPGFARSGYLVHSSLMRLVIIASSVRQKLLVSSTAPTQPLTSVLRSNSLQASAFISKTVSSAHDHASCGHPPTPRFGM